MLSPLDELLHLHNVLHASGKDSAEHTHTHTHTHTHKRTHTTFTVCLNVLSNGLTVPAQNNLIMRHLSMRCLVVLWTITDNSEILAASVFMILFSNSNNERKVFSERSLLSHEPFFLIWILMKGINLQVKCRSFKADTTGRILQAE